MVNPPSILAWNSLERTPSLQGYYKEYLKVKHNYAAATSNRKLSRQAKKVKGLFRLPLLTAIYPTAVVSGVIMNAIM